MVSFEAKISDKGGFHARPAAHLMMCARESGCRIVIRKDQSVVDACNLMKLMGMKICTGDIITVEISGEAEKETAEGLKRYFEEYL